MESLSSTASADLRVLRSPQLSPRPHQVMFQAVHQLALDVGAALVQQLAAQPPARRGVGIFRRHSSASTKKPQKDKKRLIFANAKARSAPKIERDFSQTDPCSLLSDMESQKASKVPFETAVVVFHQVVKTLQQFVTTFAKTDRFVFHLASMRRMFLDLHAVGVKLDYIMEVGGLEDIVKKEKEEHWEKQLQAGREKEEAELSTRAAKNALPFARKMLPHEPMEALTLLKFEIDFFKPGNSTKHVASMKKVFFSVVRSSNGRVAKIPDWYIPPNAMNYSREKAMLGSVGTTHRGVWEDRKPPDGKKPEKHEGDELEPTLYNVVVKRLLIHADAIEVFRQEVETWFMMDHPNILKLYGASHCSRPALLVFEDATNGPLVNHLALQRQLQAESRREKRKRAHELEQQWPYRNQRHALWSLFLQAAEGLLYLHDDRRLVHSNLKSDNILVTADGQVKLTDFGLGMLALQNHAVQDKKFQELGWRAPNCRQKKLFRPSFQDDIYSLGLCVLDVLVPSLSSIVQAKSPNGPRRVGEEEFDPLADSVLALIPVETHRELVVDMCQVEPAARLTLEQVISRMQRMRDEAALEPADSSECCIL
ncbi:LIM domain kinase 1 [Phytophthora ramorum]